MKDNKYEFKAKHLCGVMRIWYIEVNKYLLIIHRFKLDLYIYNFKSTNHKQKIITKVS